MGLIEKKCCPPGECKRRPECKTEGQLLHPLPMPPYDFQGNPMSNQVSVGDDLVERLKVEAQGHAQEARTANATIYEIYQVISGATGEPGNWHGAQPVRDYVAGMEAQLKAARESLEQLVRCEYESAEPGLCDCIDNTGQRYQSEHLAQSILAAEAALNPKAPS